MGAFTWLTAGNVAGLQSYLRQGGNPHEVDEYGTPALNWAIHHGQEACFYALLQAGADPQRCDVRSQLLSTSSSLGSKLA